MLRCRLVVLAKQSVDPDIVQSYLPWRQPIRGLNWAFSITNDRRTDEKTDWLVDRRRRDNIAEITSSGRGA